MKTIAKAQRENKQNRELIAWGLILLVFVVAIAQVSNQQIDQSSALGVSAQAYTGSPEIGR
ncbi:MAG: hypothetical protein AABZ31_09865 [Bdellovibrionota bacterium]